MAFTAQTYNVCVKRGDTWVLPIQFFAADGTTPIDLTGQTVRVQVRETATADVTLLDLTEGSGLTVTAASGLVEISADTSGLTETGSFAWALELSGSTVEEPIGGQFKVVQDVVRTS